MNQILKKLAIKSHFCHHHHHHHSHHHQQHHNHYHHHQQHHDHYHHHQQHHNHCTNKTDQGGDESDSEEARDKKSGKHEEVKR